MYTVYNIHACQVSRDLEKKMGRGICIVSYIRGVVSKIESSQNPNPHPLAAFCRMLRYYREHFILSISTCFNLGFFFLIHIYADQNRLSIYTKYFHNIFTWMCHFQVLVQPPPHLQFNLYMYACLKFFIVIAIFI